jgi:hypothetical protein
LSELAKLGAGLIIQRAVEDAFNAMVSAIIVLGRLRYGVTPDGPGIAPAATAKAGMTRVG